MKNRNCTLLALALFALAVPPPARAQSILQFDTTTPSVSNGSFHAGLIGPSGRIVVVEASADLQSWTPIQTNALPPGGVELEVSMPLGTNQHEFFRARLTPSIDLGYGPNLFYYLRNDASGFSTFGAISTSGAITDRFGAGSNFVTLTFAGPDIGYGPNLFYHLRQDASGFSTFGTISTSGAITDRFGVGLNFDALTFAGPDIGYGPNLFYYLRHDASGSSTFGTISTGGVVTDRFGVGFRFDALTFAEVVD